MRLAPARFIAALLLASCAGSSPPPPRRQARLEQQPGQAASADQLSRRELTFGAVVGSFGVHTAHVWRGLPYARPPVGPLRWKAPRPVEPWEDVRELLVDQPPCVQPAASRATGDPGRALATIGQEDCLYLDLYAPAMNAKLALTRRLPVMLWIHGGGNVRGASREIDAGRLALQRQVLVVVPNYRLGPLGWFSHPALDAGAERAAPVLEAASEGEVGRYLTPQQAADAALASADRSGNYGTLDLIAALEFVRENIARFGGDPENVTIAGQGSGGGQVLSLLLSPRAKGLFRQALAQSPRLATASVSEARAYGEDGGQASSSAEVLVRLLIAEQRAATRAQARTIAAAMGPAQAGEYLRAQPAARLLAASAQPRAAGDDRPEELPSALRDGAVIHAEPPLERFASGGYNRVPIVLGTNRDEVKLYQAGNPELVVVAEDGRNRILDPARYQLLAEYRSEAWRALSVNAIAPLLQKAQGDDVFVYRFDWDEEPSAPRDAPLDPRTLLGAAHGFELPFVLGVFDSSATGWLYEDTAASARRRAKLSRAIMAYFTELAYQGKPGSGRANDLWEWEPWGANGDVLVLDTKAGGDVRMERGQALDLDGLLARLARDPRTPEPIDKCRVLFWLTERGDVPKNAYATTPGIECKAYPSARYPWTRP